MNTSGTRAGYAALLGRPNVGKSTLLNRLLRQKISITSAKPQTTRHAILGIETLENTQIVYVDTPGLHLHARRAMNRYMNRAAAGVITYVDLVVLVVEALRCDDEDRAVLERLADFPGPVILAVNKVDRVVEKSRLLPFLQELGTRRAFAEIIPVSATKGTNLEVLERAVADRLPEADFLFDADQVTTVSQRFIAAELIREQLIRRLHQELPYSLTVEIEGFQEEGRLVRIDAAIWVERPGQKGIVIGRGGAILKEAGRAAREAMERLFERKVFLQTWVKVREDWSDDERALRSLGFGEPDA